MKAYYRKDQTIGVSMCDAGGRLGVANTFALFQDAASEHAELLGVGLKAMQERKAFWLTTRSRVHFYRRPEMMARVQLETWPLQPGSMRCDRCYRLRDGDTILAEGRSEWCVLDLAGGRPAAPAGVFPADIEYCEETLLAGPYARYRHDFTDEDRAAVFTVRSGDIDVGRHLNNVAYLRMICSSFSVAELDAMDVSELEIWFSSPCFEGDALEIMRRRTESGFEFGLRRPDRRYAALARLELRK